MDERERIAREIIKLLPELARSLNRDVAGHMVAMHDAAGNATGSPPEVSGAQLRTLIHLAQYGPQTMGELAEGLQITMASATGLVKPLVQMGYVTRGRDVDDQQGGPGGAEPPGPADGGHHPRRAAARGGIGAHRHERPGMP